MLDSPTFNIIIDNASRVKTKSVKNKKIIQKIVQLKRDGRLI